MIRWKIKIVFIILIFGNSSFTSIKHQQPPSGYRMGIMPYLGMMNQNEKLYQLSIFRIMKNKDNANFRIAPFIQLHKEGNYYYSTTLLFHYVNYFKHKSGISGSLELSYRKEKEFKNLFLTPEIGIYLFGVVYISYGYNFHNNFVPKELNYHRIGLRMIHF